MQVVNQVNWNLVREIDQKIVDLLTFDQYKNVMGTFKFVDRVEVYRKVTKSKKINNLIDQMLTELMKGN